MHMTLLGVTGSTGQSLLKQVLARRHEVTAVARNPAKVSLMDPHLRVLQGDVNSFGSLQEAFPGSEVVISCVGVSNPRQAGKGTTVYSVGTRNIVEAMRQAQVKRLIVVSSAGVAPRKGAPILYKLIVKPLFLEPAYRDMRLMEELLCQTELEWTVVRPPYLTAKSLRTDYRFNAGP